MPIVSLVPKLVTDEVPAPASERASPSALRLLIVDEPSLASPSVVSAPRPVLPELAPGAIGSVRVGDAPVSDRLDPDPTPLVLPMPPAPEPEPVTTPLPDDPPMPDDPPAPEDPPTPPESWASAGPAARIVAIAIREGRVLRMAFAFRNHGAGR
ncbi:hypothetical protein SI859A1_03030 [Aurantimonas manganoxydans SI85-9A1]|uniref:Uncharacterized protein n=1 Tax=Aurantimonas manganoxydans (strain ATCC BAA-1229 / DSM 21871 / SI85-9A1) TaxID=287752 RepID=Q1YFZ8_AURMS|nr:hypothetical protein SI859A1_03030 [Aurantimonas manganoxydans SI85-9A1]